jgi:hypothetical protein
MKTLYLFEIDANEKPIYGIGEWESLNDLTADSKQAGNPDVFAYGEIEAGKYIELFQK